MQSIFHLKQISCLSCKSLYGKGKCKSKTKTKTKTKSQGLLSKTRDRPAARPRAGSRIRPL